MQNKFNVGEVYKELRKARKISQKDVVRDKLSISQLSKFENGQTMIGADKMLEIIDGINITFYEFSFILRNFKPSKFQLLTGEIIKYSNLKSIDKLLELLSKHEKSDLIYDRLNCLLIKSAIFSLDSQYSLLNEDSKLLTSYLYEIESWSAYDLYLFGNTMIFLSNDDLIFLARELEKKIMFYSPLLEFSVGIKFTYMNLISELMVRKLKK